MSPTRQFCTFRVDDLYLGIEVAEVQEVIRFQEMTRVPHAPSVVRGLINLRGQIVTAVDLRLRFERPVSSAIERPMNVVLETGDGAVSLLVDEIADVVDVSDDRFEPPPVTLRGIARRLIEGAYKLDDELLLVLDVDEAIGGIRAASSWSDD